MALDFDTLEKLRQTHPAWKLLCADQAPLILSFLYRVFIEPNQRFVSQSNLAEALEDVLYSVRLTRSEKLFPKSAQEYLNDWTANEKRWLRKFYRQDSDEPYFDLTPDTEKAISWIVGLGERNFVGTESRLLLLFELLKQMTEGTETSPEARLAELQNKKQEIEREIERVKEGNFQMLDDTAIKDRFQQFIVLARELLSDFREVEQNFRMLDRKVREKIALWEGSKGALLEQIIGERDEISNSDQGKSFKAFWEFLMNSQRQEELTKRLEKILALPALASSSHDPRMRRIHYDWIDAGDHTQRTVAQLSQQLRRFLDDAAFLENKRIMQILHDIESKTIELRDCFPEGDFVTIAESSAEVDLPMERPLYAPTQKVKITEEALRADDSSIDVDALFMHQSVDSLALAKFIRECLLDCSEITLKEIVSRRPLEYGLAELVVYLHLATNEFDAVFDEDARDDILWENEDTTRQATIPRVIFVR